LRRTIFALVLVLGVSSASLVLTRLAPGDVTSELLSPTTNTEIVERERARYGLDRPILSQYGNWLWRAARLDLGVSFVYGRPVRELIGQRAANTALLALCALVVATAIGIPLGVMAGSRDSVLASMIRGASTLFVSLPPMLISLALVLVAARTGWFPTGGMTSIDAGAESWGASIVDLAWHLILPTAALALPLAAILERIQAQAMRETLREPFVLATLGRGVPYRALVWRDALRPALRGIVAIYGLAIGTLFSGSFIVEIVTSWPGLGRLMFDALRARDIYLVAGCAAAGGIFLAIGSLLSDLALAVVDPRLRD
jgi:peptide/nickel transport system permease protein